MMSVRKSLSMTSGVFFLVLFALSFVSAQNDFDLSPESDLESIEEIQELLRNVQTIFETKIASKVQQETVSDEDAEEDEEVNNNGCKCLGLKCSCCAYLSSKVLNLKGNACVSITFLRLNSRMLVTLKYESRKLYSSELSATSPPKICVGISFLRRYGSLCIQFSDLLVAKDSFKGSVKLTGRLIKIPIMTVKLGSFKIKFDEAQQIDAMELPYLDVPKALPEGPQEIYIGEVDVEEIKPAFVKKN